MTKLSPLEQVKLDARRITLRRIRENELDAKIEEEITSEAKSIKAKKSK
jgi:hypothetical protein